MGRSEKNIPGNGTHDPGSGLVTRCKDEAVFSQAAAEHLVAIAGGPCASNRYLCLGQVYALPLGRLMGLGGERFDRTRAKAKMLGQLVRKIVASISPEGCQDGPVMSTADNGMVEHKLQRPGDLFMPSPVMGVR